MVRLVYTKTMLIAPLALFFAALPQAVPPVAPPALVAPAVRREFRGVWLATVANIDWPSKPGLPTAAQQAELLVLLDRAKALNFNAVVFQVRPMCDAMYASPFEPWSEFLTGADNVAPSPYYDPLTFAVDEAHKRGLELHAWFNPYRARSAAATTPASDKHVSKANPKIVRSYGKQLWLDPAMPETREYSLKVMVDVATRYALDGVHIDDYFYPYVEKDTAGNKVPFPDADTYATYKAGGGTLSEGDFRRDAVDGFVRDLYAQVHAVKPGMQVGISPFGIAIPGVPAQIKGFDQKAEIYADAVKWLNNGWCDYLAPQLYWPIERTAQSFPVLLQSWIAQNPKSRALYPGLYTGKYDGDEIAAQVRTTRGFAGAGGTVHFSMKSLLPDAPGSVAQTLQTGVYAEPALSPEMPWLIPAGSLPPPAPKVTFTPEASPLAPAVVRWILPSGTARQIVVQAHTRAGGATGTWRTILVPASYAPVVSLPAQTDAVNVFAVDQYNRAGAPVMQVAPAL